MTARSPAAFLASATLHALFVAVMLYTTYVMKDEALKTTQVFELVAGEGDNYEALEAPALGTPEGIKFDLPEMPAHAPSPVMPAAPEPVVAPAPEPVVTPPQPEPVAPAPPEVIPVKPVEKAKTPAKIDPKTPAKVEPKVPNFTRTMKTKQAAMAKKQKAAADRRRKEAELAAKRLSYQEFQAQQKKGGTGTSGKRIDAKGIAQGVVGGSTSNTKAGAGGTALSREEQDMLQTYFALVTSRLKEAHEQVKPEGSDSLTAEAEFFLSAEGGISRARIARSSGNAEFDNSVLAAFRAVPTIGRSRPDHRGSTVIVVFRMREADE